MKKLQKMNEAAWLCGVLFCAFGVALATKASFGLSMIAAPPYILHLFMEKFFPWFTQGTAEYVWQGVLLIILCIIVRRFKVKYLLTFGCALLFGFAVDGFLWILGGSGTYETMAARIIAFVISELVTAFAIACYFRTDMPLPVYELVVAEIAKCFGLPINKVKQGNDIIMLVLSVVLALGLNHSFKGIGIGTVIITLVNASLIALAGKIMDKYIDFSPRFPKFIEKIKV